MLKPQDPITLYGPDSQVKRIPAIDAPGWLAAGWSTEPIKETVEAESELGSSELPSSPPKRRKAAVIDSEQLSVNSEQTDN
ncbi:hypothetical protein [Aulosira sp. FACHB-615]|uniref:hypothetical protein n=1 Tax=Aulosira sp. FACHB-615 TaxID=2692777 RepID=UPI001683401D|nr:hypothetical protein [Aulosira sp. FACHB-615]MBD2488997.1 hypothetical protein [Aulosira sp. FACHB-615]